MKKKIFGMLTLLVLMVSCGKLIPEGASDEATLKDINFKINGKTYTLIKKIPEDLEGEALEKAKKEQKEQIEELPIILAKANPKLTVEYEGDILDQAVIESIVVSEKADSTVKEGETLDISGISKTTKITVTSESKLMAKNYTFQFVNAETGIKSAGFIVGDDEKVDATISQDGKLITIDRDYDPNSMPPDNVIVSSLELNSTGASSNITEGNLIKASGDGTLVTITGENGKDQGIKIRFSVNAEIPDTNFRAYLKEILPQAFNSEDKLDTNNEDVKKLISMNASSREIKDLTGIQFFLNLKILNASSNELEIVDLSKNTGLLNLNLSGNLLTEISVEKNIELVNFECAFNENLRALNVTKNKNLALLRCSSCKLASLDISNNTVLETLNCSSNILTSLDVSNNVGLTFLGISDNKIANLDASRLRGLEAFNCSQNDLKVLDITGITSVQDADNLVIDAGSEERNLIQILKINKDIQTELEVKEAKTSRGTKITISTYDNLGNLICGDYNPNNGTCSGI